jgi:hypothetical protein
VTKLRVGWEVFAPRFVAHSLAVEVDGERRVTMAFAGELVSPMVLFFPSFGLGLGLPVELAPTPIAGVRAQMSVQFP